MLSTTITDPFATLAQEFEKMFATTPQKVTYPPYNVIYSQDKDIWYLEFAVAGFSKEEIDITTHKDILTVKGEIGEDPDLPKDLQYVYKGIAGRKFTRSFNLPEYVEVDDANLEHGILTIKLIRNVPEEKKPRSVKIK